MGVQLFNKIVKSILKTGIPTYLIKNAIVPKILNIILIPFHVIITQVQPLEIYF